MNTKRIRLISILVVGLILAGMLAYQILAVRNAMAASKSLVGSWNVEVTVVQQNSVFPSLMTFYNDGNLITDETPSPLETSGHGDWVRTGPNKAAYTFVFLIGSTEPGQWLKGTVSGEVNFDPRKDTWNGPFTIKIVDQDGNEVLSDTGTMDGTRISAAP
jgi:hypothetical protein